MEVESSPPTHHTRRDEMNAQHESQTGTWNGWTEPASKRNPMDDAAACPVCGLSPRISHTYPHGVRYHSLECEECHPDLQTEGFYRLDAAVKAWNELVEWFGAEAAHQQKLDAMHNIYERKAA